MDKMQAQYKTNDRTKYYKLCFKSFIFKVCIAYNYKSKQTAINVCINTNSVYKFYTENPEEKLDREETIYHAI